VSGGAADVVFLLDDDSYLHFAFVTGYNSKDAMLKSAGYDIRLHERDGRDVYSVIIYTADVKTKPKGVRIGTLTYNPDIILMSEYDGNSIFAELEAKINAGQELKDIDILNLVFLPLMKHTLPRKELAKKTIMLAQKIPDVSKRNACMAAAFGFARKYVTDAEVNELLEVMQMSELVVMLVTNAIKDVARKMLQRGMSISAIAEDTGLDESTIRELQEELNLAA